MGWPMYSTKFTPTSQIVQGLAEAHQAGQENYAAIGELRALNSTLIDLMGFQL